MTTPPPTANGSLGVRHFRTVAGIVCMGVGIAVFVAIQYLRAEQEALLAVHNLPATAIVPPTSWMQFLYTLAIPVLVPLVIFGAGALMFSPVLFTEIFKSVRSLLPWTKGT